MFVIYSLFKESIIKEKQRKTNNKILYFLIVLLLPAFFIVINRNSQWRTSETLIEHDIKHLQNSAMANEIYATNQYGLLLLSAGPDVLRMAPSLIIPEKDILQGMDKFHKVVEDISQKGL